MISKSARPSLLLIVLAIGMAACGARDQILTSSSALATTAASQHPLVGNWLNIDGPQDLIINANGSTLSQNCDSRATIGDIEPLTQTECGNASKSCGSFPYVVSHARTHPSCVEAGSYICFYNVYRVSATRDQLALNCSDGKGVFYYGRR
jgi:hypothetical protein